MYRGIVRTRCLSDNNKSIKGVGYILKINTVLSVLMRLRLLNYVLPLYFDIAKPT